MNKLELNIKPAGEWISGLKLPLIIAGPCSAETEEQLLMTASGIAKLDKVSIFRAGVWKPRTRPDYFEGVGSIALEWLKTVKQETGLLTAIEVANTEHLEQALKNEVDILWIGARTTVNPFYVQEIADALKGVDIPVMVKNPINPDLSLWAGALERFNHAGITKLIAIHRGFSSFEKTPYRYAPMWEIPIELKILCPDLLVICDPSHISGDARLLQRIAQKALDLDMAGLMIETHINPKAALSDAQQQITPTQLDELLSNLVYRKASSENIIFENRLEELREIIDKVDEDLLHALSKRMEVVREIGEFKRDNNITILQIKRWKKILRTRPDFGKALGLTEEFTKKLYKLIHKASIQKQTEIMNSEIVNEK
ncbi:MAG: chorismate mutase [Bacteroidota bacterium]